MTIEDMSLADLDTELGEELRGAPEPEPVSEN